MPERAALGERVAWHLAHAENCGCREMPGNIKEVLERDRRRGRGSGVMALARKAGRD